MNDERKYLYIVLIRSNEPTRIIVSVRNQEDVHLDVVRNALRGVFVALSSLRRIAKGKIFHDKYFS